MANQNQAQSNMLAGFIKAIVIQAVTSMPAEQFGTAIAGALGSGAFALPVQTAPALPAKRRGRPPASAKKAAAKAPKKAAAKAAKAPKAAAKAPKAKKDAPKIRDMEAFNADAAKITAVLEAAPGHALQASAVAEQLGIEKPAAAKRLKQMTDLGTVYQGGKKRFTVYGLSSKEANAASLALKGGGNDGPSQDAEVVEETDANADSGEHPKANGAAETQAGMDAYG